MKTITVNQFHGGVANDPYDGSVGQFVIAKHFDVLTYPNRLQPLRGMVTESVSNSKIGNMIVANDGAIYGSGCKPTANTKGNLWTRPVSYLDAWVLTDASDHNFTNDTIDYSLLVDYPDCGNAYTMFFSSAGGIFAAKPSGASNAQTQALLHSFMGQGFVHPKNKNLYIPYNDQASLGGSHIDIGAIAVQPPNATAFTNWNAAALTLPTIYNTYCLTNYGNYLAIPSTSPFGSNVNSSLVYLWDMDTSNTTPNESINWGGHLKVLNNLDGVLIGVGTIGTNYIGAGTGAICDSDSIVIKGYNGGTDPFLIKEIFVNHLAGAGQPLVTINQRVNFVYKNRLYFSVSINPNDGVSETYYGLWSVGKNKVNGQYTVNMERVATNANTDTGVIACAISGDFVTMCHTTEGTLTVTIGSTDPAPTSSATYAATSVYESLVNPNMVGVDRILQKSLLAVGITTLPMTTGQQVVMKYRVDSTGAWNTLFTKTPTTPTTDLTFFQMSLANSASGSISGRNLEFRLESTGGAVITGYEYKYDTLKDNIL